MSTLLRSNPKFNTVINGYRSGFAIQYEGPALSYELVNHKSAIDQEDILLNLIDRELVLNRVAGPYNKPPLPDYVCSPLGLVPKKEPGKYRFIHDLSLPIGGSVNSFIPDCYATVKYETFDEVVKLVLRHGNGALIAKADILEAFRIIPIRPSDYHLLGFKIKQSYYYDRVLPMGCRSSCQIFESFSKSLQWLLQSVYNFPDVTHVLDDFIFVGPSASHECMRGLKAFLALANYINLPIKHSKTVFPSTCVTVYGIEIDTLSLEARLPHDKLVKAILLLENMLGHRSVSLKDLQKLLGLLNFCCKCIKPGRAFLRRMWDVCSVSNCNASSMIELNSCAKQDMTAWVIFLRQFNGVTLLSHQSVTKMEIINIFSDAAKSLGYSFVLGTKWYCDSWTSQFKLYNIVILELIPIVMAVCYFAQQLRNRHVIVNTDNSALVYIINSQSSKCKFTMLLIRKLVVQCLLANISLRAVHLSSEANLMADLLSRLKVQEAIRLFPHLDANALILPHQLKPCFLMRRLSL